METQQALKEIEEKLAALSRPNGEPSAPRNEPIAIIGFSGSLPQSQTLADFWQALDQDRCLIEAIPRSRFDADAVYDPSGKDPQRSHTKWGGFIPDIQSFDPLFFNVLPREAVALDPRQRLLLMSVYHALEDAGYAPLSLKGSATGMFVGAEENEYIRLPEWTGAGVTSIANAPSMIANQISYFFDWRGPSEYSNSMCAGGAVALHRAVVALRGGECAQAVVGVANLLLRAEPYVLLSRLGQISPEPTVHAFGAKAKGYLPAEGVASVLLKPLSRAEADGDAIYAVLEHSVASFNGQGGMSIAAPNIAAHRDLVLRCYREAGIDVRDLTYLEAQGMGNPITDIAEWTALNRALTALAAEQQVKLAPGYCKLSSLKPMMGHMQSASAFGALFKIVRAFQTDRLHKILNFEAIHPDLETRDQPCALLTETQAWPRGERPRLAGLHAYGAGGANVHLLLKEYRTSAQASPERAWVLPVSARSQAQVRQRVVHLSAALESVAGWDLAEVALTLQHGRDTFKARLAFVSSSLAQFHEQMRAYLAGTAMPGLFTAAVPAAADADELAQLALRFCRGEAVTWPQKPRGARRCHLPGYPFALEPYWLDPLPAHQTDQARPLPAPSLRPADQAPTLQSEEPPMKAEPVAGPAGTKAVELFTYHVETSDQKFHEDYLTFCPFPERIPGFSMTRVFLNPKQYRKEMALIQRQQIEMRQVLFFKEDFQKIRNLMDFGCGHGTDVIQIAHHYPHIHTDGFTITGAQAAMGNHRIAEKGLTGRARIFENDSSKVRFPKDDYDVIIGLEVSCLISDKQALFRNIDASLKDQGRVLLMDFIANLRGAIEDPTIDIYIPNQAQWVENLAQHHLVIDELVDVSPQIANFQHDPDHAENVKDCPKVVRDSWRNYANNSVAIERGWLSYVLFRLRKDLSLSVAQLRERNEAAMRAMTPYPEAVAEMARRGPAPYPILDERMLADAYPDLVGQAAMTRAELDTRLVALFERTLSLPQGLLAEVETFTQLGITSINAVELLEAINQAFALALPTSTVFAYNTLGALGDYLYGLVAQAAPAAPTAAAGPLLEARLAALFQRTLGLDAEALATHTFNELGISSIHAVELMEAINAEFGQALPTSIVFATNTLAALAEHLGELMAQPAPVTAIAPPAARAESAKAPLAAAVAPASPVRPQPGREEIAIVGMAGRCAQAPDLDAFWQRISAGESCIEPVRDPQWRAFLEPHGPGAQNIRYGRMEGFADFDHAFFRIDRHEAEAMDPMQRVLLEDIYSALEDAGHDPAGLRGRSVGTYIGCVGGGGSAHDYSPEALLGMDGSILSARMAYFLDLKGPALTVNTACSSSLVAMELACQQLHSDQIELAIAGGVTLYTDPGAFVFMQRMGMLSPTGQCRPFDREADGFVVGDGSGVVILKRMADALRDRDAIHGAIVAIGSNQKGQTAGMTVPSFLALSQLQERLYRESAVAVDEIQYIETHGTASKLGDPIEFHALNHSFQRFTTRKQFCALGSVKANIGHTTAAAGVLGVIKVLLAFRHEQLPPCLNFKQANEHIDFANSPFYVSTEARHWPEPAGGKRLAAVTALGYSGTNAHLVLRQVAPVKAAAPGAEQDVILPLSAKTPTALRAYALKLAACLTPDLDLRAVAYTLQVGREQMRYRCALLGRNLAELQARLLVFGRAADDTAHDRVWSGDSRRPDPKPRRPSQDLAALAADWVRGVRVDWLSLYGVDLPMRLHLPSYAFERVNLARRAAIAPLTQADQKVAAAEADLRSWLLDLIAAQLGQNPEDLDPERSFFELGLDSLAFTLLRDRLGQLLGTPFDTSILFEYGTLAKLSEYLTAQGLVPSRLPGPTQPIARRAGAFPELVQLNGVREGRPVFWIHGGLGGVQPYHALAAVCGRPFYGIQARGWRGERAPLHGVQAMAAYYIHAIQSVQPCGPYDLGGYSLGGLLAYEIARQLQELGETVAHVVMVDTFDLNGISTLDLSVKSEYLQAVNIALQTKVMQAPDRFAEVLIHRDELDASLDDASFLKQLVDLAKTRGLRTSDRQLADTIRRVSAVQRGYEAHRYQIAPLPDPNGLACTYFLNGSGVYMGDLAPYFLIEGDEIALDDRCHWEVWSKHCPKFQLLEVASSNHLVMLSEAQALQPLTHFCRALYAAEGPDQAALTQLAHDLRRTQVSAPV